MQPRGSMRAGSIRPLQAVLFAVLVMALIFQGSVTAHAQSESNGSTSTISGIINALGLGPRKPEYKRTRFIVELGKPGEFQVFALTKPNRVVIQVPNVPMRLPLIETGSKEAQLVKNIRSGVAGDDTVRIVVNVATPVIIENKSLTPSGDGDATHRLSLDIVPVNERSEADATRAIKSKFHRMGAGTALQPPLPRLAETPKDLNARSFKPVIVIDPGHGGQDTGAMKFGVREKDVVLAFSLMLRDKLEATGRYRVLMTRSTDVFVSLEGRRDFADKHKAALFISVHADYASTSAEGATIYSLRDQVARRLKQSAKEEVARKAVGTKEKTALLASAAGAGVVKDILSDLAKREVEVTKHRTDLFSRTVIREMEQTTTMRRQPNRSAGFRVIKTAKMPSVLIELAYVSNRRDARRLTSEKWRNEVSSSIVKAVDDYFAQGISRLPM
jgi:N-acetylmuramoyl-L-alanine amidase